MIEPTYFVKHPDGTYSEATPQPASTSAQGVAEQTCCECGEQTTLHCRKCLAPIEPPSAQGFYSEHLKLQDGSRVWLNIYTASDAEEVQRIARERLGFLPANCTELFWMDGDNIFIIVQNSSAIERLAHEAFHAASAVAAANGLDPNDYNITQKDNARFQYIPAEVCADLCEQIVSRLLCRKQHSVTDDAIWLHAVEHDTHKLEDGHSVSLDREAAISFVRSLCNQPQEG